MGVSVGSGVGVSLGTEVAVAVAVGIGWVSVAVGLVVVVAVSVAVAVGVSLGGTSVAVGGSAVSVGAAVGCGLTVVQAEKSDAADSTRSAVISRWLFLNSTSSIRKTSFAYASSQKTVLSSGDTWGTPRSYQVASRPIYTPVFYRNFCVIIPPAS